MTTTRIRPARPDDRPALLALLQQTNLLTDDLPTDLSGFWLAFAEPDGAAPELIGSAGVEVFGRAGLLRSVAVRPDYRNQRIAGQLLAYALEYVNQLVLNDLYLITTTAGGYFGRHGFGIISRQTVPDAIRQTRQFTELCPDSAMVMHQAFSQEFIAQKVFQ